MGVTREYEFTGDTNYLDDGAHVLDSVALRRSYVIGGDSDHEQFFPTNEFARHLSDDTCETCNTYNMLKLTRELFALEPDAVKMDFYERALYNDILASQDPDSGHGQHISCRSNRGISKFIPRRRIPSGAASAPAWKTIPNMATRFISTMRIHCS